jgi:hypothetical protein
MSKDKDLVFPRLMYRGPADDHAETQEVADQEAADVAGKAGWRLTRVDKTHAAPADTDTIKIPAQTVTTSAATVKDKK